MAEESAVSNTPPTSFDAAYARLRRLANRLMANERVGHTLGATDVVHEAMARLMSSETLADSARGQGQMPPAELFWRAARAMNQILIDHARRRGAIKRGGRNARVDLDDLDGSINAPAPEWDALDESLQEMRTVDPRRHAVVTLRFFGGLDNREIAKELGLDERTVGRDWAAAKLWLKQRLDDEDDGNARSAS